MTHPIRQLFLEEFVKSLIKNVRVPTNYREDNLPNTEEESTFELSTKSRDSDSQHVAESFVETSTQSQVKPEKIISIEELEVPVPSGSPAIPKVETKSDEHVWGRLSRMVSDPTIKAIECSGPDKQITMNLAGATIPTPLKLDHEEIKRVITEVAERTHIPIVEGVFKAELENIVMTAVLSEYGGSRFVIHKKS